MEVAVLALKILNVLIHLVNITKKNGVMGDLQMKKVIVMMVLITMVMEK